MKITPYREWTEEQHNACYRACHWHPGLRQNSPIVNPKSPGVVLRNLADGVVRGAFIDGYLVVYDVGPTWCCDGDILHEYMTAHPLPGGKFSDYVTGLQIIADVNGCVGILTGNGVLRPGLKRLYERAGFVKQNEAYFLGVQHGRIR